MLDEYHGAEDMNGLFYCPICQQTTTVVKDGKCPKCGATMDELSTRAQQTEDAISRQAAIEKIHWLGLDNDTAIKCDLAIRALPSVIPSRPTEPCSDAVSRTEFIVTLMDSGIDHLQADNLIEIGEIVLGLPPVQPSRPTEPCEDAISRQAALEKIHWLGLDNDTAIKCDLAIRALPCVTPKQRTGRWEIISGNNSRCSTCGIYNPPDSFNRPVIYNYCPFCGAKMG